MLPGVKIIIPKDKELLIEKYPIIHEKLLEKGYDYITIFDVIEVIDTSCKNCWDDEAGCACWNDE